MSDITRSEAIDVIESIMRKYEEDECVCCDIMLGDEEYEALRLARDSLKTDEAYNLMYEEPDFCEDCISRKTALMYIDIPQGGTLNDIRDAIRKMPSVLPKATKNDLPHCQHTDEEIAKSFIEDVEAVKDQLPTTKNDLGVDAILRADARSLICNTDIKHHMSGMSRKVFKDLYNGMDELPSVTPQEPTTKNDLALIHTEGLDEEIRCTMCTNSIKSDRGCDGGCVVNNAMYKEVMDVIENHIVDTNKEVVEE